MGAHLLPSTPAHRNALGTPAVALGRSARRIVQIRLRATPAARLVSARPSPRLVTIVVRNPG